MNDCAKSKIVTVKMIPRSCLWLLVRVLSTSMMVSSLQQSGLTAVTGVSRPNYMTPTNSTNSSSNEMEMTSSDLLGNQQEEMDREPDVSGGDGVWDANFPPRF